MKIDCDKEMDAAYVYFVDSIKEIPSASKLPDKKALLDARRHKTR